MKNMYTVKNWKTGKYCDGSQKDGWMHSSDILKVMSLREAAEVLAQMFQHADFPTHFTIVRIERRNTIPRYDIIPQERFERLFIRNKNTLQLTSLQSYAAFHDNKIYELVEVSKAESQWVEIEDE